MRVEGNGIHKLRKSSVEPGIPLFCKGAASAAPLGLSKNSRALAPEGMCFQQFLHPNDKDPSLGAPVCIPSAAKAAPSESKKTPHPFSSVFIDGTYRSPAAASGGKIFWRFWTTSGARERSTAAAFSSRY